MVRESFSMIDSSVDTVIYKLFESAGRYIPDFDGHRIRIAERNILWSKFAQQTNLLPPSQTPEQIAEWNRPKTFEEWEAQIKYPHTISNQEIMDHSAFEAANSKDELSKLLRPQTEVPTGTAHVQKPFVPTKRPTRVINVPGVTIEGNTPPGQNSSPVDPNFDPSQTELLYTPGPGDPNYIGASKSTIGLLKVADYLNKKKS